ncbi:hypothetical protein [Metapseudomonas boanensis]|uniref:Uncharacterized protein n=1 Tax=Metapseudomonas boanensis TaxID=2822138 RepID=A0ABS5XME0_9GAMM|nr:hypothetical protein [Pseudomonas boanensis]MBT8768864.1 hypothetical protein [Pseudomonas boanensis]
MKIYSGCPAGANLPAKLKIREPISTYKEFVYQFYRSATQSESEVLNAGDEQVMDKRANISASWQMLAVLVLSPLALIGGGWLGYDYI